MRFFSMMIVILTLSGCATATRYTDAPMQSYDKDTEYAVEPKTDGFLLSVLYDRYQFIPESSALAVACKSALTTIAYEYADEIGKKIQPVNEQRIKLSMGRNGMSGITSCSASTLVFWEKQLLTAPE